MWFHKPQDRLKENGIFARDGLNGKGTYTRYLGESHMFDVIERVGHFSNACLNDAGVEKVVCKDGRLKGEYVGHFRNGAKNGEGKQYIYKDGRLKDEYVGHFRNGAKNGEGKQYIHKDGRLKDEYVGHFRNGAKNGEGKEYIYKDGKKSCSIEGEFCDGVIKTGKVVEYSVGQSDYSKRNIGMIESELEGNWEEYGSICNGVKTEYSSCHKSRSEGEFLHGVMQGYGHKKTYRLDGSCLLEYTGEFWHGFMEGQGKCIRYCPDGQTIDSTYQGGFKNGRFNGHGSLVKRQIDSSYVAYKIDGDFTFNSVPSVFERIIYTKYREVGIIDYQYQGSALVGPLNKQAHGNGKWTKYRSDGKTLDQQYTGAIKDGKPHGFGEWTKYCSDGITPEQRYVGFYKDGVVHGEGIWSFFGAGGTTIVQQLKGVWRDGWLLSPIELYYQSVLKRLVPIKMVPVIGNTVFQIIKNIIFAIVLLIDSAYRSLKQFSQRIGKPIFTPICYSQLCF